MGLAVLQVASRLWLVWGILAAAPAQVTSRGINVSPVNQLPFELNLVTLLTTWSVTEIIRYSFFAIKVLHHSCNSCVWLLKIHTISSFNYYGVHNLYKWSVRCAMITIEHVCLRLSDHMPWEIMSEGHHTASVLSSECMTDILSDCRKWVIVLTPGCGCGIQPSSYCIPWAWQVN